MDLYPAIDLRDGRCVRLVQGDYEQERVYDDDPVAVAKGFEAAGAAWIHVVDLDAARTGEPANRDAIAAVADAVDVPVQSGGGVRDEESAAALLDAGVRRVVIGTAAVEDPDLVEELAGRWPRQVAVGVDVREGEVAVRGWTAGSGLEAIELIARFENAGVGAFVITDISRDGTLAGPNVAGLATVLSATGVDVVASGGVATLDDLRSLADLRAEGRTLAGAIVGTALYEGRFTVEEGVTACRASE